MCSGACIEIRAEPELAEYLVTCLGKHSRKLGVFCTQSKCSVSIGDDADSEKANQ